MTRYGDTIGHIRMTVTATAISISVAARAWGSGHEDEGDQQDHQGVDQPHGLAAIEEVHQAQGLARRRRRRSGGINGVCDLPRGLSMGGKNRTKSKLREGSSQNRFPTHFCINL